MENTEANKLKATPLGGRIWSSAILFGLIGQVAWVVENMYFATFAQNIFSGPQFHNEYYIATTLMVIFSAITATVTTIFAGGFCDKVGKRRPFISFGYICWGLTIMLFAIIPIDFDPRKSAAIISMLVIFDCIMTVAGSTANDAAFNTWVTDVTDVTNRGIVNTVLSIMPVVATVLVFVIAMFTFDKAEYTLFFMMLGVIPIVAGILSFFLMRDSKNIVRNQNNNYLKETFYGFRAKVIKENKMMYVALAALCIIGVSQQIFFSYLINFIEKTLGIKDYIIPLAGVVIGSALITGTMGIMFDKFGRKNFYFPILAFIILGTLLVYLMKFMPSDAYLPIIIVIGILMLGALLCASGALMSAFQDYIPKGYEGRFQGIRMCFTVMIPMIVGPLIALTIGVNTFDTKDAAVTKPPFEIFLAAAIVALFAFIPIYFVRKDADRLRKSLMDKQHDAADMAKAAEQSLLGESDGE